MRHSKRLEDVRVGERAQRLAGGALDDAAEQVVAAVVVLEFGAGREVEAALTREHSHDGRVLITRALARRGPPEQPERVAKPARVRQQVPDGDVIVVIDPFRDVLLHLVVQRELAVLGGQHDAHRGEGLGD